MSTTYQNVDIHTITQVVELAENVLGCQLPTDKPWWKVRQAEAGKLNRRMKSDPQLTIDNLVLAVEWCRRRRIQLESPVGLCLYVPDALKHAAVDAEDDLARDVDRAVHREMEHLREGWQGWVSRLTRARGPVRADVLAEWSVARVEV